MHAHLTFYLQLLQNPHKPKSRTDNTPAAPRNMCTHHLYIAPNIKPWIKTMRHTNELTLKTMSSLTAAAVGHGMFTLLLVTFDEPVLGERAVCRTTYPLFATPITSKVPPCQLCLCKLLRNVGRPQPVEGISGSAVHFCI